MAHSVSAHLRIQISDYDRAIRTFIPGYDAMRAVQLDLLAEILPERGGKVLDLGGGTGALAAAVAKKFPSVQVEIWDTDPQMLAVATERCAGFEGRVRCVERSFTEPLSSCDAVVACIALHHVKDVREKGKIYANVYRALRVGGIFANADVCMSSANRLREASFKVWAAFMGTQGITPEQAKVHFADWAQQDFYLPLCTELDLVAKAGCVEPECFWRTVPFTVFGGVK